MGLWCALNRTLFGSASSKPAGPSRQTTATAETEQTRVVGAVAYGSAQSQQRPSDRSAPIPPAAMTAAVAAYNALPSDQQTPERARELGVTFGMWNAVNSSPPPVS